MEERENLEQEKGYLKQNERRVKIFIKALVGYIFQRSAAIGLERLILLASKLYI
jgi:hypothetical protein